MTYLIFLMEEIDKIDFNEVLDDSPETLRISKENKAIVKYNGEMPKSIQSLKWKSLEYSHKEILRIINTEPEWLIDHPSKITN